MRITISVRKKILNRLLEKQSMGNSPTKCRLADESSKDMHVFSILDNRLSILATLVRSYKDGAKGEAKEIAAALLSKIDELLLPRQMNALSL